MSAENVAIVKSSWAGWRQRLRGQMVRDFADGLAERIDAWDEASGHPGLQPEEFIDAGDVVIVRASPDGHNGSLWFNYTMGGRQIAGWAVYEDEAEARAAAGL